MCKVFDTPFTVQTTPKSEECEQRRCNVCLEHIRGTKDFRKKGDELNPRVKSKCMPCKQVTCIKHVSNVPISHPIYVQQMKDSKNLLKRLKQYFFSSVSIRI